jgi:DNA-binding response OmpR family regulator
VTPFDTMSAPAITLAGMRVLLVEDEFLIQLELEALLTDAGACVAGLCGSIKAALDIAERESIDVALLDVRLGPHTVAPVARLLRGRGIPFVFYTGQTDIDPTLAEWPDAAIVPKPSDRAEIIFALQTAIGSPRKLAGPQLITC